MVAEMETSEADVIHQDDSVVEEKQKKSKLGKLIPKVLKKSSKKKKKKDKKHKKHKKHGGSDDDSSDDDKRNMKKKNKSSKRKNKEKSGDDHAVETNNTKSREPQTPKTSNESLVTTPPGSPKPSDTVRHPVAKIVSNSPKSTQSSPTKPTLQNNTKPEAESDNDDDDNTKLKKESSSTRIKSESEKQSSFKKFDRKSGFSKKRTKPEKRLSSKKMEEDENAAASSKHLEGDNKPSSPRKLEGKKSSSSKNLTVERNTSKKLNNDERPSSSQKLEKEDTQSSSRKEKRRSSKKMKNEESMRTSKQKEARKQSSSKRKKRKDNLDREFLRSQFRRSVRKLIWSNIFFQQTALKALEMQNRADEVRYQKSCVNSQLKDMFLEDDDDVDQPIAPLPPVVIPSPLMKPKQSSVRKVSDEEILKDFEDSPVAKPKKPKKTVHFPDGPELLKVKVFPKQYDPFTKSIVFYTDDEIKKFRFEKYLEDHEDEFEEVVDMDEEEFEWIEEEIIEIEEGYEFEEVEYVYEEDAVSI